MDLLSSIDLGGMFADAKSFVLITILLSLVTAAAGLIIRLIFPTWGSSSD